MMPNWRTETLRKLERIFRSAVRDAHWDEWKHQRNKNGEFVRGAGGQAQNTLQKPAASGKIKASGKKKAPARSSRAKVKPYELLLPRSEYGRVMHNLLTNMTREERELRSISKPIGNYCYLFEKIAPGEYIVTGKRRIYGG